MPCLTLSHFVSPSVLYRLPVPPLYPRSLLLFYFSSLFPSLTSFLGTKAIESDSLKQGDHSDNSRVVVADVTLNLDLHFTLHLECQLDLDLLCRSGAALQKEGKAGGMGCGEQRGLHAGGGSGGLVGSGCLLTHINHIQKMMSTSEG